MTVPVVAGPVRVPRQTPPYDNSAPVLPEAPSRSLRQRFVTAGLVLSGLTVLLLGYLRMARGNPTNADAAANALQAWDMSHGNPLLHGWTLSDVSFYTTELVQYALIEAFYGLDQDVVHVASAITYTLLIVFAALVAQGGATSKRAGWLRAGIVVATMLVPEPHSGWAIVLYVPDHTGTAVPLLVTWLLVERLGRSPLRGWWPVGVAGLLAIAQIGDPLALFIGAVPLAAVSGLRLLRERTWRGPDAHLLVAAVGSVAVAHGALALIWWGGGFSVHSPIARFSPLGDLPAHVAMAVRATALNYGAYFPHLNDGGNEGIAIAAGVVNLALLALAMAAVVVTLRRMLRGTPRRTAGGSGTAGPGTAGPGTAGPGTADSGTADSGTADSGTAGPRTTGQDRVAEILATAIVFNFAAYIASTQAAELTSARQIVAVLPFGAALAARVWADRLAALPTLLLRSSLPRRLPQAVVGVVAAVLFTAFVVQAGTARAVPPEAGWAARWLDAHDLRYGLGSYWASNNITLTTHGRVHVAPVVGPGIRAFRWESNADWYDAARHDARFVVIDLELPKYGTVESARVQFGGPVERHDFGRWSVLVYDHNLLAGLPAQCGGLIAAAHVHCPPLPPKIPGANLLPSRD